MVVVTESQRLTRTLDIAKDQKREEEIAKKHKSSPYKKWTQVNNSKEAYEAEDWLMPNAPIAYRIFRFMVSNMDQHNAIICSYKVMQEKFGYSHVTLSEAIQTLKEHKYLDVKKSRTSNVYLINKTLYWNSWGSNFAYAEFGAKVILSLAEQDQETQEEVRVLLSKRTELELKTTSA